MIIQGDSFNFLPLKVPGLVVKLENKRQSQDHIFQKLCKQQLQFHIYINPSIRPSCICPSSGREHKTGLVSTWPLASSISWGYKKGKPSIKGTEQDSLSSREDLSLQVTSNHPLLPSSFLYCFGFTWIYLPVHQWHGTHVHLAHPLNEINRIQTICLCGKMCLTPFASSLDLKFIVKYFSRNLIT